MQVMMSHILNKKNPPIWYKRVDETRTKTGGFLKIVLVK